MNTAVTWLGVLHCLSTSIVCKGILELPMTSLVEEFKCDETSLEMPLSQPKDSAVKNTAPTVLQSGVHKKRFNMHKAHYSIGVQSGRAGFGLGYSWKA